MENQSISQYRLPARMIFPTKQVIRDCSKEPRPSEVYVSVAGRDGNSMFNEKSPPARRCLSHFVHPPSGHFGDVQLYSHVATSSGTTSTNWFLNHCHQPILD
jgi:hypothetical protein